MRICHTYGADKYYHQCLRTHAEAIRRHDTPLWLADKGLFALDCATNRMREVRVKLPQGSYATECALAYHSNHDVCVALIPRTFSGPMQTFLFRFDPAGPGFSTGVAR